MLMDLNVLMTEDEAIAEYTTTESPVFNAGAVTYQVIVSNEMPLEHQDLAGCLEDTLHRLLNASASAADIEDIMGAVPFCEIENPGNDMTEIDLGYAIPGHLMTIRLADPPLKMLSEAIQSADNLAVERCPHPGSPELPKAMEL